MGEFHRRPAPRGNPVQFPGSPFRSPLAKHDGFPVGAEPSVPLDPAEVRRQFASIYRFLRNKWWFDELYRFLFVRPVLVISGWVAAVDRKGIDWLADNAARTVVAISRLDDWIDRIFVDALTRVLREDPSAAVRVEAATALARHGDEAVAPLTRAASDDDNSGVRAVACLWIGRMADDSAAVLPDQCSEQASTER